MDWLLPRGLIKTGLAANVLMVTSKRTQSIFILMTALIEVYSETLLQLLLLVQMMLRISSNLIWVPMGRG
jgi:hypothetical protein